MTESGRLVVVYVPGLDRRRLVAGDAPFIASLFERFPSVRLQTHPTTELFPTLIAGVDPPRHLVWQVSRRDPAPPEPWWMNALPDALTSTLQCARHAFDSEYDLPAIPWRRRRRFNIHRLKYTRRAADTRILNELSGYPTLFGILQDRSRYRISTSFREMPALLETIPDDRFTLDFLEFYAFDLLSHWNLDRPDVMARHSRIVDRFVEDIVARCERTDARVILLVDHGQERVTGTIDLGKLLQGSGVDERSVLRYVEVGVARFWFESDAARSAVRIALESEPRLVLKTRRELADWGLEFSDDRFGELYAIAKPGTVFFPHDFFHPLANLYMGISKPFLWRRLLSPIHRATHGQLPGHVAEEGFVLLLDEGCEASRSEARLADFAPTILTLLGRKSPSTMAGESFFRAASSAVS